ncbi:probable arabinosyltransferase ARAD1 [Elaeis guineensis]|uniref:Probable arabinosyltransferase ARAD1 n=1 Tax=Elaeis guineensis var. tenera TaxID=51953 RepID=A0A6I9SJ54_ELAGV|nr:probable arabinosyltransferase ARAD1 [Elaeis guineensis]
MIVIRYLLAKFGIFSHGIDPKMADKNPKSLGFTCRKPVLFLFTIAPLLFLVSWFFLLASTDRPHFMQRKNTIPIGQNYDGSSNQEINSSQPQEEKEQQDLQLRKCDPSRAMLKVFMYDLPPEFHFGLLDWKPEGDSVWPDIATSIPEYPGGLNLQHSIEYWLTLDLLSSRFADRLSPCTAVRVLDSRDADVVFVPFFSSLSFNRHSKIVPPAKVSRDKLLQDRLVKFLTAQDEWKRSGGRDHIILAHHPNSLLDVRMKLWPCMFILSDFGRYPPNVANVEKDIIAPYRHVINSFVNDSSGFDDRPTLLFFRGAIYRKDGGFIRQELFYLLRDEKDVHFAFGSIKGDGINEASQGMHSSKYCLNIAGDTPSSNRLFDAIASHCVPVIISDEIELPFEDIIDYSEFCVFARGSDAVKKGFLLKLIRSISRQEWTRMWKKLKEVEGYFEFQFPSQKDDAVQMIWQAVTRKVPAMRLKMHRLGRFSRLNIGKSE